MVRIVLLSLLLGISAPAVAKDQKSVQLNLGDFSTQYELILKELQDGETYKEIAPDDRVAVHGALERIDRSISDAGDVDALSRDAKIAVFNDQELVNTLLTQAAEDSRLICRREKRTGSHRAVAHCMTVAERDRAREDALEELRRRPTTLPPGG